LCNALAACSTSSKRVPAGIFAPVFIYNIDRSQLIAVKPSVSCGSALLTVHL
jgi:hypothetical protein